MFFVAPFVTMIDQKLFSMFPQSRSSLFYFKYIESTANPPSVPCATEQTLSFISRLLCRNSFRAITMCTAISLVCRLFSNSNGAQICYSFCAFKKLLVTLERYIFQVKCRSYLKNIVFYRVSHIGAVDLQLNPSDLFMHARNWYFIRNNCQVFLTIFFINI